MDYGLKQKLHHKVVWGVNFLTKLIINPYSLINIATCCVFHHIKILTQTHVPLPR